jgi:hypothetical protein
MWRFSDLGALDRNVLCGTVDVIHSSWNVVPQLSPRPLEWGFLARKFLGTY